MSQTFDLLVGPIGCLVPCHAPAPRLGPDLRDLPTISGGAVGILGEKITFLGPYAEVSGASTLQHLDASNCTVLPGLVDPHTHVPFLGDRAAELVQRLAGKTYMEIGREGGGIVSTMRSVRQAAPEQLLASARDLAHRFLSHGVTTFEAKSGYGLDIPNEIKQLTVLKTLAEEGPQTIISTCLAAHFVPPEFKANPEAYVDLLCDQLLPEVARRGLAKFCDVFCEEGAFTPDQSRRVLLTGKALGLLPRLHADEIEETGGAALAAEVGAVSADHLMAVSDSGIQAMSRAGVCATLLPGTSFFLRKAYAPARKFVEAGCPVALSTDCNPGSSYTTNLLQIATLGVFALGLMPEEALWAVTLNAAYALREDDRVGSLTPGKRADLSIWSVPSYLHLFYPYAENPLRAVVCGGRVSDYTA